jgi:O-antigen biosynthesis protein
MPEPEDVPAPQQGGAATTGPERLDALTHRLENLERNLELERQARVELAARLSDQQVQILDLTRATRSILSSRIWRTLQSVGGRLLSFESLFSKPRARSKPVVPKPDPSRDAQLISILMPVYETPEKWLRASIESVLHQSYPSWELCITNDGSKAPHVGNVLSEYAAREGRIRINSHASTKGIAATSNTCLEMARGEFVALLDHDDELTPDALTEVRRALKDNPSILILYSDEDKIDENGHCFDPFFKPGWSPEYLLGCMYTGHLGVYRTDLVRNLGGFRPEVEGAQDYDLALRATGLAGSAFHIPKILYHWRTLENSMSAGLGAKEYAYRAAFRALTSHLESSGFTGAVLQGPGRGAYRVRYDIEGAPDIAVLVLSSAGTNRAPKFNWPKSRVVFLGPSPAAINTAAFEISADYMLLLQDQVQPVSADWMECLIEYCQLPGVGAVGPKLLSSEGRIESAGIVFPGGRLTDAYAGWPADHPGYFLSAQLTRNYLAVSGACMMTKVRAFRKAGGIDSHLPVELGLVDYCLRLHKLGFRTVFTPFAEVVVLPHDSADARDLDLFHSRWAGVLADDPYYNPGLPKAFAFYPQPPTHARHT